MIRRHLVFHLKRVEKRLRRYRLLRNTAICWGLSAGAVFGIVLMMSLAESSQTSAAWWVVAGSVIAVAALVVWNRIRNISSKAVAHAIERKYPDLNERLLTAVEEQTDPENQLSYLREQLVSEVLVHHRRNNWLMTVPKSRMLKASLLNLAGLALFLVSSVVLYRFEIHTVESRTLTESATTIDAGLEYGISVEPGDQSIERGTGQVFLARFSEKLPADVTLVLTEQGAETRRIPLSKSLDDPLFGGQVSSIRFDSSYFIEYDDLRTRDYRITVFDFSALLRADATITFPEYADLPDTVIPDARSLSFVEGSTVTIACFLNKPVKSARLLSDENEPLKLKFHNVQNNEYRIALTPKQSGRYRLELVDDQGRRNKYPPEFDLSVVPNQRPNLKLAFPAKDLRVSPLEEMALEGTVWDDFGLKNYGVIYTLAGRQPVTVVLGKDVSGKKTEQIVHQVSFEDLSAEPDELVSYYLFAEDFGPDGKLRKTFSDMFFAEVRHFEEIFREGRQPPGGQSKKQQKGGQSQQADQLAQLQKQIINATWNVYRRESAMKPSQAFPEDVGLIEESQKEALKKVREIEKKLKNPKSKALVKVVADHMKQAAESLEKAVGETNIDPLSPALTSEQGAYKALLKLRATEHQVSRSQQSGGGGGGGGGNRSQQQLQQLELSNKQNRYQTNQNAAQANANSTNREQLQVLNRLRELARRQGEINEKVKELQTALREAKTEEQKEKIRRRLKRLQEEQQRMLRDIDTLSKRMDQPDNQKQMTDSRKQLDQTRSQVLKSSEALKEGRLSQALNAGTRAERDLENMREEFRKKTAGRFSEEMKDLKNRANELQEKEKNLAQKLDEIQNSKRRTLRDAGKRDEIREGLQDQKGRIDDLQDRMRKVIQQAENSEPLLSKQLYETVRQSREKQPQKALEIASELVNRGLLPEAEIAEKIARKGIDSLKQGIDKAAESVLGNELDSLKQAQNKLDELRKSLDKDLAQADPQAKTQANNQQNRPSRSGKQNSSKGKNNPSNSRQAGNRQASQGKNQQAANTQQSKSQQKGSQKNGKGSQGKSGSNQQSKQAGSKQASSGKSGSKKSQGKGKGKGQGQGKGGGQSSSSSQANNSPGRAGRGSNRSGSILQQGGRTGGEQRGPGGVLTGNNFQQWSDQMRDVEEMIGDLRLRAQAEKVRERARRMRVEFKRHSKEPNQELVRTSIYEPLVELQKQIAEEIAKKESKDALVPIDRDPVPTRYSELVRKYYQELSNSKKPAKKRTEKNSKKMIAIPMRTAE